MSTAARKVLVIGGGVAGMSAGITLSRGGSAVDLIDIDPRWKVSGAGLTITGATLRALRQLGVYEQVAARGYVGEGIQVCNVAGEPLYKIETPVPAEADVAGCGGIMRPALHKILSARLAEAGASVRLGLSVTAVSQDLDGVDVTFSDGSAGRYDLVVGADGISSATRGQVFPGAPVPRYTGQSVWRIVTSRPAWVQRRHFFLGGPNKVGFTPVSGTQMYLFVNERTPQAFREGAELRDAFISLLAGYGGIVGEIRDQVTPGTQVVFRPLEAFFMPAPWHVGRVILIGDAAHPTTPQLASGAGIAVEDAIVLAEELARSESVPDALGAFTRRREDRCRLVVTSSLQIGRLEQEQAPPQEQTAVVNRALAKLAEPI